MEFEKIREILAEELDIETSEIELTSSIQDDLGADSLDMVEIIMAVEDEFDMKVAEGDAENIKTVGDIVDYVKK